MIWLRTLGVLAVLSLAAWGRSAGDEPRVPAAWEVKVRLEVVRDGVERVREGTYTLRLADDLFRLDLGGVRVLGMRGGDGAVLQAWHAHDPTTIFVARGDDLGLLIRQNLPALWSGVLARWVTGDDGAYALVGHDWAEEPSEQADPAMPGMVVWATDSVSVRTVSHNPRGEPFSETVETKRSDGLTRLELKYVPIDPGDPELWGVDQGGRARVSSIRALTAKPAAIKVGEIVGGVRIFDGSSQLVDLRRAFVPEGQPRGSRRADGLLLIFECVEGSEVPGDLVDSIGRARGRLAVDSAEREVRRPMLVVRPVAVFDVPEFSREELGAFAKKWSGLEGDALLADVEAGFAKVLWTHPPRESIDLFAPGARVAGVLTGPDGRLMGVVRLDEGGVDLGEWLSGVLGDGP